MKIFDLEQEIVNCWGVLEDIDLVYSAHGETSDELANALLGLRTLYDLKFQKLWNTFEETSKEYHMNRRETEKIRSDYGDDMVASI